MSPQTLILLSLITSQLRLTHPGLEILPLHPQAGARRRLQVHAPAQRSSRRLHHRARRRHPHRQADGGHHRERGRVLQREFSPRGHQGDEGGRLSRLLDRQQDALRLQQAHGAGRAEEEAHPGTDPDASRVVKRIFDMAEAGTGMLHIARTLNDEGIASPAGKLWSKNGIHFILRNEVYTGTLIWGANAKDKADPIRIEKAFPAIISKAKSQRVNRLMRSRAPKVINPRRVGSSYLLSGLVKCHRCNRALSGQDAKSGQFSYYVCQSIMKRGKDACETPRLNARRFEELVVGKIRSNVLTEGNILALVKVVDEQMDGVAREQRNRLETIEDELEDVKRKLGRIWHFVETTDIGMADASDRIKEHRERQGPLEEAAADARAILSQRRTVLDDVNTISAYAQDMSEFLNESELTERRAFIETFVKEIVVMPGDALLRYTIPMPDDSPIPGRNAEEMALNGSVLSTVKNGGPMLAAAAIGALALLVAMMALVHPASAEGVAASCATGGAVPNEASTGLVADCDALLVARDTLAGSGSLNWSVDSSIADWEGVILAGSPLRVTGLHLEWVGLAGELALFPEGVILSSNQLTGEIPSELGSLANLEVLDLTGQQLGGGDEGRRRGPGPQGGVGRR